MKACEILDTAFGIAGEKLEDFPDKSMALIWLNVAVAEALKTENIIRERKGKKHITLVNLISDLDTEVEMDSEICHLCLPMAVAAFIYSERGNDYLSAQYRNRYIDSLQNAAMGMESDICDCYGGKQ